MRVGLLLPSLLLVSCFQSPVSTAMGVNRVT